MDKREAIVELVQHDHAILDVDFANQLGAPFGIKVKGSNHTVGKDRVVAGPSKSFKGIGAHELAEWIARRIGAEYPMQMGIGSRLRVACEAVLEALDKETATV